MGIKKKKKKLEIDLKDRFGSTSPVYSKSEIYVILQFNSPLLALWFKRTARHF